MHIRFPGKFSSDKFISVVILSYKRPDMTLNLINSLHRHADMPFELIVHDDSSPAADKWELYQYLDKTSSLILTGGELNMGLAASFERGVSLASSDYVLCLNNDTLMVGPGFKRIVDVIKAPYVGAFGPWQVAGTCPHRSPQHMTVDYQGIVFQLGAMVGNGSIMAFRKSVWEEVGGWPHVMSGSSDTAFMRTLLRAGYFNALRALAPAESFDNVDYHSGCVRSTIGGNVYDASYPWLFNVPDGIYNNTKDCQSYVQAYTQEDGRKPAGINNNDWWHNYMVDNFVYAENNFNWDALTYHSRFREQVERDRVK